MTAEFYLLKDAFNALVNQGFWYLSTLFVILVAKNFIILLFRSIIIKIRNEFREGDIIEINGYTGEVVNTTGFRIRLRDEKGNFIIIPIEEVFDKPYRIMKK